MAIEVTTYNIGQGLFNLVCERFDNGETRCGVVDCGTLMQTRFYFTDDKLVNAVNKIKKDGKPCLSYIVISHQDNDHWSKILDLIGKLYNVDQEAKYKNSEDTIAFVYKMGPSTSISKCWKSEDGRDSYSYFKEELWYEISALSIYMDDKIDVNIKIKSNNLVNNIINMARISFTAVKNKQAEGAIDVIAIEDITNENDIETYNKVSKDRPVDFETSKGIIAELMKKHLGYMAVTSIRKYLDDACEDIHTWFQIKKEITDTESVFDPPEQLRIYLGGIERGHSYCVLGTILSCFGEVQDMDSCILYFGEENFEPERYQIEIDDDLGVLSDQMMTSRAISRNATSIMTLIQNGGKYILLPGDATLHAFSAALGLFKNTLIDLMIAPHHGSYHTNVLLDGDKKEDKNQPVKEFFKITRPQRVFISAKHECFGHPDQRVFEFMKNYTLPAIRHKIGVCCDKKFYEVNTEKAVYSTETYSKSSRVNMLTYAWPEESQNAPLLPVREKLKAPEDKLFL